MLLRYRNLQILRVHHLVVIVFRTFKLCLVVHIIKIPIYTVLYFLLLNSSQKPT